MIARTPHALRQRRIVGRDHSTLADGDGLDRVEGESGERAVAHIADPRRRSGIVAGGAERVAGVLHDRQVPGQCRNRPHGSSAAGKMHDGDCLDRPAGAFRGLERLRQGRCV